MRQSTLLALAAATATALAPSLASAHAGVGDTVGFAHGFMHPASGVDHVLAMAMVGVFARQLGGRSLWLVPATFVLAMALGGATGVAGIGVPAVEAGIALSVVVLGAIVAFGVKAPVTAAMAAVGLFAIFHGHAHGAEMPESAAGLAYGLGFMLGTALLHAVGVGLGFLACRAAEGRGPVVVRTAGAVAAFAGVAILAGVI